MVFEEGESISCFVSPPTFFPVDLEIQISCFQSQVHFSNLYMLFCQPQQILYIACYPPHCSTAHMQSCLFLVVIERAKQVVLSEQKLTQAGPQAS